MQDGYNICWMLKNKLKHNFYLNSIFKEIQVESKLKFLVLYLHLI